MASAAENDLVAHVKALRNSLLEERSKNAGLEAALAQALEQQAAASGVLRVISSSPTDLQPVAQAIADSASRLCDCTYVGVFRFDGELIHWVAARGTNAEQEEALRIASGRARRPDEFMVRPDHPRSRDLPCSRRGVGCQLHRYSIARRSRSVGDPDLPRRPHAARRRADRRHRAHPK